MAEDIDVNTAKSSVNAELALTAILSWKEVRADEFV